MTANESDEKNVDDVQQQDDEENDEENDEASESAAANPERNQPQQQQSIVGNPRDVLCGRGLHILNHHGNLQLHLLVNKYRNAYRQARRQEKSKIIRMIIKETKKNGVRFLKRDESGGDRWVEVDDKKAYEKVSHALRLQKVNESNKLEGTSANSASSATQGNPPTHAQHTQNSLFASAASTAGYPDVSGTGEFRNSQQHFPAATGSQAGLQAASSAQPMPGSGQMQMGNMYNNLQQQILLSMLSHLRQAQGYGSGNLPPGRSATSGSTTPSQSSANVDDDKKPKPSEQR
eukprot:scaffold14697_cov124-Cylindrotheca_fusiformis.AAC.12